MPIAPDETFIPVEKDGAVIHVHPLALQNHLALGWKVVVTEFSKSEQPEDLRKPMQAVETTAKKRK